MAIMSPATLRVGILLHEYQSPDTSSSTLLQSTFFLYNGERQSSQ